MVVLDTLSFVQLKTFNFVPCEWGYSLIFHKNIELNYVHPVINFLFEFKELIRLSKVVILYYFYFIVEMKYFLKPDILAVFKVNLGVQSNLKHFCQFKRNINSFTKISSSFLS
jgi:hypothetical protein